MKIRACQGFILFQTGKVFVFCLVDVQRTRWPPWMIFLYHLRWFLRMKQHLQFSTNSCKLRILNVTGMFEEGKILQPTRSSTSQKDLPCSLKNYNETESSSWKHYKTLHLLNEQILYEAVVHHTGNLVY